MSTKNPHQRSSSSTKDATHRGGALKQLRWFVAVLVAALAIATMFVVRREPAPALPAIDTTGFEPVIVDQIQRALSEVRAQPRSGAAWGKLGLVLQAHELSGEARACFGQAERFATTEARWPYFHGLLLAQQSPENAIDKLRRASDLAGDPAAPIRLHFAQTLLEAGRVDDAEAQFKKLAQGGTNQSAALLGLAEIARSQGRLDETRRLLQPCLKSPFTAKRAQALLSSVERQLGDATAAIAAARAAATLPPDQPWPDPLAAEAAQYRIGRRAWSDLGQQFLELNRVDEAEPVVSQLTRTYPDAPEGWLLLGRLRFVRKDCPGAEQALRRHLQLASNSVNGHFQLGITLLCLEKYSESAAALQQAIELKPDFGEAHFNYGFALARSGRGREAIPALRGAIRYNPDFVDPYIILADLLIQTGEKPEARQLLKRALQLSPGDERARTLQERAAR
jgi:tetratricopeptide (TPR) repeat protein